MLPIWNVALQTDKPLQGYPESSDTSLGAALKRPRLKKGWTIDKTANFLQLIPSNYSRLERNGHIPDVPKRRKINEFLQFNYWDDNTNDLSNRLLLYRIDEEINATVCGERMGISRNTIKRKETKIRVSKSMIEKVDKYLYDLIE